MLCTVTIQQRLFFALENYVIKNNYITIYDGHSSSNGALQVSGFIRVNTSPASKVTKLLEYQQFLLRWSKTRLRRSRSRWLLSAAQSVCAYAYGLSHLS